jgi:hypothetical protein
VPHPVSRVHPIGGDLAIARALRVASTRSIAWAVASGELRTWLRDSMAPGVGVEVSHAKTLYGLKNGLWGQGGERAPDSCAPRLGLLGVFSHLVGSLSASGPDARGDAMNMRRGGFARSIQCALGVVVAIVGPLSTLSATHRAGASTMSRTMGAVSCPSMHCVAVGSRTIGGGSIPEAWSLRGAGWVSSQINTANQAAFDAVSCPFMGSCMAVGSQNGSTQPVGYAAILKSGKWTPLTITSPPLAAVSCLTATRCMAVGTSSAGQPTAEYWNGTNWRATAAPLAGGTFDAVSCASDRFCMAVGEDDSGGVANTEPLAEEWDGTRWTVKLQSSGPLTGPQGDDFTAISCLTATFCAAAGFNGSPGGQRPIASTWNGSTWKPLTQLQTTYASLNSVSCATRSVCWAVGTSYATFDGLGPYSAIAERWNGSGWAVVSSTRTGEESDLSAVSCPDTSWCNAVGSVTNRSGDELLVEHWNGTSWRKTTVPGN